ncbi:hypothetical protein [Psychroflexus lacisalsi]|jgi:hypothetical protein|uniref:Uncharacterized protein n=1 Tax=Psychroflexus lacisalsi TaxID=503928 RepID=A0ABN1KDR4_9FLAO|nr:hypothetical protein [Psychroflexus lacisalsi]MBZ9620283.1 hypothetical protein [Psychroflexus lacisalsi]
MKRFSFFLFLNLFALALSAQPVSLKMVDRLPVDADQFWGVDTYQRLYFSKNNVFYKTENQKQFQFQDLQLGELESVDLLNPLKILLFYKEANTLVILDNRLNEVERINFNFISDFKTVDFAGISKDNLLWIFNADLQQLELFDYQELRTRSSSLPINKEVLEMKSNYNFSWLLHPNGFSKLNINGSLIDQFNYENAVSFNIFKNQVMVQTEIHLEIFGKDTDDKIIFKKPEITFNQFYFNDENIYIYSDKVLYTYRINIVNN